MTPKGAMITESKRKPNGLILDETAGINYVPSKRKDLAMGYTVRAVYRRGGAKKAGIREGDVITKVGNRTINSAVDVPSALAYKRKGDVVSVTIRRPGKGAVGPHNITYDVVLGGTTRKGRKVATLGVISKPAKANAYKEKVRKQIAAKVAVRKTKKVEKKVKITAQDLSEDLKIETEGENHFMKQAKEEMDAALQLMEDLKGADALMAARNLRSKLRSENLKRMEMGGLHVTAALNELKQKRIDEENKVLGDIVVNEAGDFVHRRKRFSLAKAAWFTTKAASVLALAGGVGYAGYSLLF